MTRSDGREMRKDEWGGAGQCATQTLLELIPAGMVSAIRASFPSRLEA